MALGRQDVDLDGLTPPAGVVVLGMSSDHLVLDVGDEQIAVGDELRFAARLRRARAGHDVTVRHQS